MELLLHFLARRQPPHPTGSLGSNEPLRIDVGASTEHMEERSPSEHRSAGLRTDPAHYDLSGETDTVANCRELRVGDAEDYGRRVDGDLSASVEPSC